MSNEVLFSDELKAKVADAVRAVEAVSSAEVVVAVRRRSSRYREADYLWGFVGALLTLLALLYLPQEFALHWMVPDIVLGFALGTLLSSRWSALRRLLVPAARMRASVERAAKVAFVDLGIARTTGRTGILIYVSVLERLVEVVADVGVLGAKPGKPWDEALARLRGALRGGAAGEQLLGALAALGPTLHDVLPRAEDDVNELPDEVQA
jgi:putative membrane protein